MNREIMICRCPSCIDRRDLPAIEARGGAILVDCPDRGHDWLESHTEPQRVPVAGEAEPATHLLLESARTAHREFARLKRIRRGCEAAWAGLAMSALCPLLAAATLPERVATAFPATIGIYEQMGWEVNIHGLEIRQVEVRHIFIDGRKVIAVKGELVNTAASRLNVPRLRFGLRSTGDAETYHWMFDTGKETLGPGEGTSFLTRLASPPEAARNLEIRFARAGEIGSNATHE